MNTSSNNDIFFREVQQFRQKWLWFVLLASKLVVIGVFFYGLYQQLFLGQPWGNRPLSDSALVIITILAGLFSCGLSYLFFQLKLITEVRDNGLYIRFFPLRGRLIPYHAIVRCEARTYHPIKEYGGWGIRYGKNGKAYNISGNQGVQLELQNDKPLLIGSQRAPELAQAIQQRL